MYDTTLNWSPWDSLQATYHACPRTAGVYEAATSEGTVVYVGSGGQRRSGRGVDSRLHAYLVGKSPDSGLIGKAADRALADITFIQRIADSAANGHPWTLREIATRAIEHLNLQFRVASCENHQTVERGLIASHPREQLWNALV